MVFPIRNAAAHLDRRPHLLEQLAEHLVHADHGPLWVVGPPVDGQDILHLRDKCESGVESEDQHCSGEPTEHMHDQALVGTHL
jgi:hypothetical protein